MSFHEIANSSAISNAVTVKEWMVAHKQYISREDWAKIPALIDVLIEGITKASDYLKQARHGEALEPFEPIHITSLNTESGAAFGHLTMQIAQQVSLDRAELTSRAFLITAISSFEILFGKVVRFVYSRNPAALSKSEHAFTLEELSQYASIQEAKESLIAQKIESLLRESVDAWSKWLQRTTNVGMPEIVDGWPEIREVFARRNILVHTDGRVNEHYIRALQTVSIDTSELTLGQRIAVNVPYLKDSLERFMAFGVLLSFEVWARLLKTEKNEAVRWVLSSQVSLVRHEMWTAVSLISLHLKSVDCQRTQSLAIRVNGWLASKYLHGVESIRESVESWDISGLSERYAMKRSLLLDLHDEARDRVIHALQEKELTRFEVATNPLFSNFREQYPLESLLVHEEDTPTESAALDNNTATKAIE
jgi:hypothetical protein